MPRTKRNHRRMALFLHSPRSMRLLKAFKRNWSEVPSWVYCKKSAGRSSMVPALARRRVQSRAVVERMLW